jgi:hypothetical protein
LKERKACLEFEYCARLVPKLFASADASGYPSVAVRLAHRMMHEGFLYTYVPLPSKPKAIESRLIQAPVSKYSIDF